jgi:Ca2+ transporting ATPase
MDKDEEPGSGKGQVCMEGPVFYDECKGLKLRKMPNGKMREEVNDMERFKEIRKHLKVLARSRPEDKYLIVTGLRNCGDVVAVTGDGTNDAPALKKADVGFGMGIAGTDVCLEAADIIIVNDNFERIVRAAKWGRNVYDNIQRFLRFQLTVNFVALTVTFIGAAGMKQSPVNAIQLLWVNLIMDSLAAMALATGSPGEELLEREPQNRDDYLVSRRMVKHIQYGSIWQSVILISVAFFGEYFVYEPDVLRRFDKASNGPWIYPGRTKDWDGTPLFENWQRAVTIYRSEAAKGGQLLNVEQYDTLTK